MLNLLSIYSRCTTQNFLWHDVVAPSDLLLPAALNLLAGKMASSEMNTERYSRKKPGIIYTILREPLMHVEIVLRLFIFSFNRFMTFIL